MPQVNDTLRQFYDETKYMNTQSNVEKGIYAEKDFDVEKASPRLFFN